MFHVKHRDSGSTVENLFHVKRPGPSVEIWPFHVKRLPGFAFPR